MPYLPIYLNIAVIIIAITVAILVIRLIKIEQKGYKLLFVCYTLFWIPLMLLRQYTGVMEKAIDQRLILLWLPMAAYGFIGIFARIFADWFTYRRKSRKSMIYLALSIGLITYIPIIIYPSTTTNVIQSLGVGVGASMIGTYQLMFNEQYGKSKQFLTVSLLSIPPLLADFISSAIQSTFSSIGGSEAKNSVDILKYL
ncbi:MAG: MFS transporter, partial [Mycoplasmataceae bacterium]|nr:MFS transporter [Mycoplasmataceae bacterium]